ncbi:MAG: TlpA family protein disulfide reductase [Gammaproteobacteria bacterium]|nr:MAG: TlpA family protein disulfide reductase [Gammaproteobacteria bacterium]
MLRPSFFKKICLFLVIGMFQIPGYGHDVSEAVPTDDADALPIINTLRPDFILPDLQGKMRNISEWQGKVMVINFWATWCPPCVREMPMFVEAQKRFADQGVQFVGVAIDDPDNVKDFVKDFDANYPLLVGGQEATIEVAYQFGNEVGILPYTAVVNRKGRIVFAHMGEMSREMVVEALSKALETAEGEEA